jgi:hypothetical protein
MSIHPTLQRIKQVFDARYAPWDIGLPIEHIEEQPRGTIQQAGWTIHFHYIRDGEDAHLDYFPSHRMTNDTLNRIYASGHEEVLGYCQEFYLANNPQAEQEHRDHNRRFYEQVRESGFL